MPSERDVLLKLARELTQETNRLDFKSEFDVSSNQAWCEIIKDIVAFSNSRGGIIVLGLTSSGQHSGHDTSAFLTCDNAKITDRLAKYTGYQFSDELEVVEIDRAGTRYPAILIYETEVPVPFTKPGTYLKADGSQGRAFSEGVIYFRHGSKSEPGNREDLRKWTDRFVKRARRGWLDGIQKVVATRPGEAMTVVPASNPLAKIGKIEKANISTEPGAVKIAPTNPEEIWPYRRKELIARVNGILNAEKRISAHDVECIKKVYSVLGKPEFAFRSHSKSSPQYSDEFAKWIVEQIQLDEEFLEKTRTAFKAG